MSLQPAIGIPPVTTSAGVAAAIADIRRRLSTLEAHRGSTIPGGAIGGTISPGVIPEGWINPAHFTAGTITAEYIEAGAIQAVHIASDSIETRHLKAGSITAVAIAADSIDTIHLKAGSITADELAVNSVTADHILAGTIQAVHLAADSVTATQIKAGEIQAVHLAADSVTATHIQAGAIDTVHLTSQSITAELLQVSVAMADQLVAVMSTVGSIAVTEGLSAISANIGEITSGTITGATVRSSATGNRFEMGGGGMNFYGQTSTPGDTVMLSFDNTTGNLDVFGKITAQNNSIIPVITLTGEIGGINLVVNSAFENTGVGGGFKNWTSQAGSSDVVSLGNGAFWGTKVMRATNIPGLAVRDNTTGRIPVTPGRWYVFSYMAKSANGGGTADIRITWYASDNVTSPSAPIGTTANGSGTITLTTGWQRVWMRAKAPSVAAGDSADAYFARIGPRLTTTTPSSYAYADAVMFSEGERPMGFNIKTDEIQPGAIADGTMVAAGVIAGNHILAGEITTTHLSATSIVALELTAGNARLGMLKANAVDAVSVQAGAINAQHLSVTAWPLPQLTNGNWRNLVGYTNGVAAPSGWTAGANAANMSVDTATTLGNALKIVNGTAVTTFMTQAVTLPKGRHIVSASVFPQTVAGAGTGGLTATVASGTATVTVPPSTSDAVWTTQEMVVDVTSASATVNIRPQLGIGGTATGTVWIGPISIQSSVTGTTLTPLSVTTAHLNVTLGGGNLLADSSFEQSITGIINSTGATTFTNPSSPKPGTGSKSFRWFAASGVTVSEVRTDDVRTSKVENGRTYTFSAWVSQASGGTAGRRCRVKALMRNSSNATLGTQFVGGWLPLDAPSGSWVRPTITFTTNNAAVDHVLLYVSVEDTAGGALSSSESFWTDAWQLEEGDVDTSWTQFLDATKIDGGTITAGTLQTAATGGRLVVGFNPTDSTLGMSVYNSDGVTKNIEILGSGTNSGRITMRNLRFVDTAGVFENIEWYKTDATTRIASLSAGSSGSTGIQAWTYAGASDVAWKSIFGFQKNSLSSWMWVDESKVQVASSINTNPHANMRTVLDSTNWSEYANTHGGSRRFGPISLAENSNNPIDLPTSTNTGTDPTDGAFLYLMEGKMDTGGGHRSSMVVLVNYSSSGTGNGVILKLAEHQFPGFGATTLSVTTNEKRLRLSTPVGLGTSTWYCTRIAFNPWAT